MMAKRITGIFLSFLLILSLLPVMGTAVFADEGDGEIAERVVYDWESNRQLLPGWGHSISNTMHAYLENAEHPEGKDFDQKVTNVEFAEANGYRIETNPNDPDETYLVKNDNDHTVLRLRKDHREGDPSDFWWFLEALNEYGTAVLNISFINLDGVEDTYQIAVDVVKDIYEIQYSSDNGSFQRLPGEKITLTAEAQHLSYDEDEECEKSEPIDNAKFSWEIEGGDDVVDNISSEGADCTIQFADPDLDEVHRDVWVKICAKNDKNEEIVTKSAWIQVHSSFAEVYPLALDGKLPLNKETDLHAELKIFDKEHPEGLSCGDPVHWRIEWADPEMFEIQKENGKPYDLDAQERVDGSAADGSYTFTITRLKDWSTNFRLVADWTDDEGNYYEASTEYYLDNLNFDLWFSYQDDDREFWSEDGTKEVYIHVDGFEPGQAYGLEFNAGVRGEDDWDVFLDPSTDYTKEKTEDGYKLTFDFEKLKEAYEKAGVDADWVNLYAALFSKAEFDPFEDEPLRMDFGDLWLREAREEYDMEQDRDLLPDWDGNVDSHYRVRVENKDNPDGDELQYEVTDVVLIPAEDQKVETSEDNPDEKYLIDTETGKNILRLRKDYDSNDPASEDYWWHYDALEYGTAELKVSYKNLNEDADFYTFHINVVHDVYNTEVVPEGETSNAMLPGQQIKLKAFVKHYAAEDGDTSTDGLTYTWEIADGDTEHGRIEESDGNEVLIEGLSLDENDQEKHWFEVAVTVTKENEVVSRSDLWCFVANAFYMPSPADLNADLGVGESQTEELQLKYFTIEKRVSAPDLVNGASVRFEYPSSDLQVKDEEGNIVGNYEQDDYIGSEASVTGRKFTFTRLSDRGSEILLWFDWTDEYGMQQSEHYVYSFSGLEYPFNFAKGVITAYSDQVQETPLFMPMNNAALTLDFVAGVFDEEDKLIYDAKEAGIVTYEMRDGFAMFYADGAQMKAADAVRERGGLELRAYLKYNDRTLREARCWVELSPQDPCAQHVWSEWKVIDEPTCTAEGYRMQTCTVCGEEVFENIPKKAHTLVHVAAKAPTAEVAGNKEYWTCNVCGKYFDDPDGKTEITEDAVVIAEPMDISQASVTVAGQTYTGAELKPAATVVLDGKTLASGTDYQLSYTNNRDAGTGTVTVQGKGFYAGEKTASFTIAKAKSGIQLSAKTVNYTGKPISVQVKSKTGSNGKVTLTYYTDNKCTKKTNKKTHGASAAGAAPVNAGTYYVKAQLAASANYAAATSAVVKLTINPLTPKVKTAAKTVKLSKVKKKAQTVSGAIKVSNAFGKVTYTRVKKGSASQLSINSKTGKISVKKGTKKGTYTIKVKVDAAKSTNNKKFSKTYKIKITVK